MSGPGTCPSCGGVMRPLFTGAYCPNDCDRRDAAAPNTGHWQPMVIHTERGAFPGRQSIGVEEFVLAFDLDGLRAAAQAGGTRLACPFCGGSLLPPTRPPDARGTVTLECPYGSHRIRAYAGEPS